MTQRGAVLVVGTIALDTVQTPQREVTEALGGSAVYFACAASFFSGVRLVGVVGTDFPEEHKALLEARGIDLDGLEVVPGKTFRWTGRYLEDMNQRETLETQLNVFAHFQPKIPESYTQTPYLFLANGAPETQRSVLRQVPSARFTLLDTMDLWIHNDREELLDLLGQIDALVINDEEACMLSGRVSLVLAAEDILDRGPQTLIIKKGSHGAMMLQKGAYFALPAFPLEDVVDPTGAGDAFAGALLGYLASTDDTSQANLRKAVAYGTVTASFTCEDFSVGALCRIGREAIETRYARLSEMTKF